MLKVILCYSEVSIAYVCWYCCFGGVRSPLGPLPLLSGTAELIFHTLS